MTVFLGIILFFVVLAMENNTDRWWKLGLYSIFGLSIAVLMMLSHWGWRP